MRRLFDWLSTKILSHNLEEELSDRLIRYGSSYGGWTICRCAKHFSEEGIFISAGVGEDISFDVDLLRTSNLLAILIDPTDRAEKHLEAYLSSSEQLAEPTYTNDGNQPISSYFSNDNVKKRVRLIKKALWIDNDGINLYPPHNDLHVSYKLARTLETKNHSSRFPSIDINSIITQIETEKGDLYGTNFVILKMDVEGSEFSVLTKLKKSSIRPRQILVELDFMRERSPYLQTLRLFAFFKVMKKFDYRLSQIEKLNCLFLDKRDSN